jgi:hypothetical protein
LRGRPYQTAALSPDCGAARLHPGYAGGTLPGCRLAAPQFIDLDALRRECLAQHRHALIRIRVTAHEYVDRRIARIGPCVDGDVALGQHRNAGYAVRLEAVHMQMQQRRAGRIDAAAQRRFDVADIVEVLCLEQVDDEVHAGATRAMAHDRMVAADT